MTAHVPTWEDPIGPNAWTRLNWEEMNQLHQGLVLVAALSPSQQLKAVGTAFVLSATERVCVCVSAAHVFYGGVHCVQFPNKHHHPTTLPEFQSDFERVELGQTFAIFRNGEEARVVQVTGACWDKRHDLCVFEVELDEADRVTIDPREWRIAGGKPEEGQRVAVIGFAGLKNSADDEGQSGTIASRLEVRVGTIRSTGRGIFVRDVAETTIPVFSGMSGSPAVLWNGLEDTPTVFGFVSSDSEPVDLADKEDFSIPGQSQISIFGVEDITLSAGQINFGLKIGPMSACLGRMTSPFIPD